MKKQAMISLQGMAVKIYFVVLFCYFESKIVFYHCFFSKDLVASSGLYFHVFICLRGYF